MRRGETQCRSLPLAKKAAVMAGFVRGAIINVFSVSVCSSACLFLSRFTLLIRDLCIADLDNSTPTEGNERSCANAEAVLGRNTCSTSRSGRAAGGVCSSRLLLLFYVSEGCGVFFFSSRFPCNILY